MTKFVTTLYFGILVNKEEQVSIDVASDSRREPGEP